MSSTKVIAIVVVALLVVGVLVGGGSYFYVMNRRKNASEELKNARDLLANDKADAAISLLKIHISKYSKMPTAPEALFLLAKTLYKQDKSQSLDLFERLLKDHPNTPYARQALYYKAFAMLDKRPIRQETEAFFQELLGNTENKQAAYVAQYGLALAKLEDGKYKDARADLDDLMDREVPDELRSLLENTLGDLNLRLLYSPELYGDDESYETQRGDYIYNLAKKFNITQELLLKCNNISDPKKMGVGQRLKIPKVNFSILVDKYNNVLTLNSNGKFFKKYAVRTGAYENQTPNGDFRIENKKKDPRWVNPRTHKMYPAGDPENELGARWMSFQGDMLGVHGAIKPETIGYYSSFGCVGMLKEDIEELFDLIPVGTPLKIVGEMNPEIVEESRAMGFRE
ncbi:L,D-transpeptidase family protein [Candidatus Sumerlaeota bacterium]|nr:L,D-transpeptidase family protein [Candidatus Sumerlaeota bacterium]